LPTLVIDHHDAREVPDVSVFVSSAGCEPVAPTGLLTFLLLRAIAPLDDVAWLALLATTADLGRVDAFPELAPFAARHRATHLKESVALLNAARRPGRYRPEVALDVLLSARDPDAVARGATAGTDELAECRAEVNAEVARVSRVAPRIAGNFVLIRFASPAQVHPLVATRWAGRLAPRVVIAADDGYMPGPVSFAMRSASDIDLLALLRGLPLGELEGEFAHGHPRATGGSIPPREFERILRAIGFGRSRVAVVSHTSGRRARARRVQAPGQWPPRRRIAAGQDTSRYRGGRSTHRVAAARRRVRSSRRASIASEGSATVSSRRGRSRIRNRREKPRSTCTRRPPEGERNVAPRRPSAGAAEAQRTAAVRQLQCFIAVGIVPLPGQP